MHKLSTLFLILFWLATASYAATPTGRTWDRADYTQSCPNGRVGSRCITLQQIDLTWDHATTRQNGDPLPLNEISHYVISIQRNGGDVRHIAVPKTTSYQLKFLPAGDYSVAISTMDSNRQQGEFSTPINFSF